MRRLRSLVVALATVALLTSCSFNPLGLFGKGDLELSREKVAEIVEALNAQDAAALKGMFTEYARSEFSAEIDDGLRYLLSMFPNGDVVLGELPTSSGSSERLVGGKKTTMTGGSFDVTSGGNDYELTFTLFAVNTIDPSNVGIFQMGAVLRTESRDSALELALNSWGATMDIDARVGGPPGVFVGDSGGLTRDRAAQIVEALNAQDVAALKGMFSEYAHAKFSAQIDQGLEFLLSQFPNGDVVWQEDQGGSAVSERIDGNKTAVLLQTFYTVTSGGIDHRLFFAEFTENTFNIDKVGIYAMGAAPAAESTLHAPEVYLHRWSSDFYIGATTPPGVFIPE